MANKNKKWIQKALNPSSKGKLHRALGVPLGEKIPAVKLMQAQKSKNPKIRKMAALAKTLSKF